MASDGNSPEGPGIASSSEGEDTSCRFYMRMLGGLELRAGERRVLDASWPRRKALSLLKLVALQPGHSLHREQVLDALWPELSPSAATRNLRKSLHFLRSALASHGVTEPILASSGEMLALTRAIRLDTDEFRERASRAQATRTDTSLYEGALDLYGGDLLPEDLYEEWTGTTRDELREVRNQLVLQLAELWELQQTPNLAIAKLQHLIEVEPCREEVHRSLMRAYARAGERDRSLLQYEQCREQLERELGVAPSPETDALRLDILSGRLSREEPVAVSSSFVGRERELVELRDALDNAVNGGGGLVLLAGEAGIGKTRTAEELATYGRLRRARVIWGRCFEGGGAPVYWPWAQIIRAHARGQDNDELRSGLGAGAADVAQIVPEIQERLGDLPELPRVSGEQARFRLLDSVSGFLIRAARRQPLVIILDDLHWADKPSLLLLEFLARDVRDARLLVLGTYRDEGLATDHPLASLLGEVLRSRQTRSITLGGLRQQDVARFIALNAGIAADDALVTAVHAQTDGNPFFVQEVIRLLDGEGLLSEANGRHALSQTTIPHSVKRVISRRLDPLSAECNDALRAASAIGRDFDVALLGEVFDLSKERLLRAIQEAVDAGIAIQMPDESSMFRFSHALVRDAIYSGIEGVQRDHLHLRLGEGLEHLYSEHVELHLTALAYHFLLAERAGAAEKAIGYARRAGEQALALFAYEDAAKYFDRALHALQSVSPGADELRCELLLALGEAQMKAGGTEDGRNSFRRAADVARKRNLPDRFAEAALGFAGPWVGAGFSDVAVVRLLEEACRASPESASALRPKLLARLAVELQYVAARDRRASLAEEAVQAARELGEPETLAYALNGLYYALWTPGNVEKRVSIASEMQQLAQQAGDRELELQGRHFRALGLLEQGDVAALDREIAEYRQLAEELREPVYLYRTAARRAMRALMDGRFDQAERLAHEAFEIGQRAQDPNAVQEFTVQIFALRREQGRLEELQEHLHQLVEQHPALAGWRCALACLHADLGNERSARGEFERLAAHHFREIPEDANWLTALTLLADVCCRLGDPDRAAILYEMLHPHADVHVVAGAGAVYNGACAYYLARLASLLERWREAIGYFEEALSAHTALGARPWAAHTSYWFAHALLARDGPGDRATAVGLAERALDTARDLGMTLLSESAAELLERAALRPPSKRSMPGQVPAARAPTGTVTMLFTDIEGSTALNESLGDSRWLEVLRAHQTFVREQVRAHHGFEVKSQGDGFMIAFRSAREALDCAIAIQREPPMKRPEAALLVRMGLHTGEAVKADEDFYGKAVNLAARIARHAKGGEILVSSVLHDLAAGLDEVAFDEGRLVSLKGVAGKQRVYSVIRTASGGGGD